DTSKRFVTAVEDTVAVHVFKDSPYQHLLCGEDAAADENGRARRLRLGPVARSERARCYGHVLLMPFVSVRAYANTIENAGGCAVLKRAYVECQKVSTNVRLDYVIKRVARVDSSCAFDVVERFRQLVAHNHVKDWCCGRVVDFDSVGERVANLCARLINDLVYLKPALLEHWNVERDGCEVVNLDWIVRKLKASGLRNRLPV